jgi:hypothetical protein
MTPEDGLGPAAITKGGPSDRVNDRIIPWMSMASFGWVLMRDKDRDGYYTIRPELTRVLGETVQIKRPHRDFQDQAAYVRYVSTSACLPKDVR